MTGREANATIPTRMPSGSWSMNDWAASRAASSRVGATSVAFIEPETSIASRTVASSRGTATTIARAGEADDEGHDGREIDRRAARGAATRAGVGARFASRSRLVNRTA